MPFGRIWCSGIRFATDSAAAEVAPESRGVFHPLDARTTGHASDARTPPDLGCAHVDLLRLRPRVFGSTERARLQFRLEAFPT